MVGVAFSSKWIGADEISVLYFNGGKTKFSVKVREERLLPSVMTSQVSLLFDILT